MSPTPAGNFVVYNARGITAVHHNACSCHTTSEHAARSMAQLATSSQLGTAPDTYFFSLAKATVAGIISSDDCLRLFDLTNLTVKHTVTSCHQGVACLITDTSRTFYTAGRDGLVRAWDARSASKTLELEESRKAGFSAIALHDTYIAAGTESTKEGLGDVSVHLFDVRKPGLPIRTYVESHTDTITDIAWHPSQKNVLLTGSTDGLISLFDVEQSEEEDAIQQVLNPRSAIHCAGFLADDQAYVLSTDEHFSVYGLNKTGTAEDEALPIAEFGDLRPKLDCMYLINMLRSSANAPILAYGHNEQQKLSLVLLTRPDYAFGRTIDLPGAHGEEVVRDVQFVDQTTIISCGEDGTVRVWSIGQSSNDTTQMEVDEPSRSSGKKAKKEKKNAERYTPY